MKFSRSIPHPFGEGLCLGGLEILTTLKVCHNKIVFLRVGKYVNYTFFGEK